MLPPSSTPEPLRPSSDLLTAWLLVLVEGGVTYGYDMRRELASRRLAVDYPTVYRLLRKLQREGRLRSRWGKTVAGPRRRLYEITPAGVEHLAEIAGGLAAISQTHDAFFQAYSLTAGRLAAGERVEPDPVAPPAAQHTRDLLALDDVTLAVQDVEAVAVFLCEHVGMQVLERNANDVLVGAGALAAKLRLLEAEGPTEPAALARLVLRVADVQGAAAALPAGTEVQHQGPHAVAFEGPAGLPLGFTPTADGEVERGIAGLTLRVADPDEAAAALAVLGCGPDGGALYLGDTQIVLEELPAWSDRPLLEHVTVRVAAVAAVVAAARRHGLEVEERDAARTAAVLLPGPERIRFEFVEATPAR